MSRNNSREPLLDRSQTASPSLAREALESHLGAESTLTLNKKKSWFGSLRDVVHRGALPAKSTVDSVRGDQSKSEAIPETEVETGTEAQTRNPTDSATSVTMLMKSGDDGQNTRGPKNALASLRNHLPKHHHKRSSVNSTTSRPSSCMSDIQGPERFMSPEENNDTSPGQRHKRHSSLANSLVGSIRGLGRKTVKGRVAPTQTVASLERPAEGVPLPSSPINIPTAAPALELDLGPSGFISPTFAAPRDTLFVQDELKLADPVNIRGVPLSHRLTIPDDIKSRSPDDTRGATPAEVLNLRSYFADETRDVPPSAPGTPMPGTNLSLEVDGANSENSDKSQVFERSVTPSCEKGRKELRSMASLDAMAQACVIAHELDDIEEPTESVEVAHGSTELASDAGSGLSSRPQKKENEHFESRSIEREAGITLPDQHVRDILELEPMQDISPLSPRSAKAPISPELQFFTPRRDNWSCTTMNTCPSDMEDLGRQVAREPTETQASEATAMVGDGSVDDPFAVDKSTGFGLPSPRRNLALPFRPKIAKQPVAKAMATTADSVFEWTQQHAKRSSFSSQMQAACADMFAPVGVEQSSQVEKPLQLDQACCEGDEDANHGAAVASPPAEVEFIENLASDDDTQTRAQALLTSDIVFPNSDGKGSAMADGLSPHGGPLVPALYQCIQTSQTPSPGSARSRTTYTAGLGDADYKFSFDNWLRSTSLANSREEEEEEVRTPHRRSMDMSIDSVSTHEERRTPQISPGSTDGDRTPSMGNRLDFDLTRSQRNMRYNALQQAPEAEEAEMSATVGYPPKCFSLGNSEEIDANAFAFADFEHAYASSRAGSPREESRYVEVRVDSEESVTNSLQDAASDDGTFSQSAEELQTGSKGPTNRAETSVPMISHIEYASPNHPIDSPDVESPSSPVHALPIVEETCISDSSADSPSTRSKTHGKDRVISSDTLDDSRHLFSSPYSGYGADLSSASPEARAKRTSPARSRIGSGHAGKPLGEVPGDIV